MKYISTLLSILLFVTILLQQGESASITTYVWNGGVGYWNDSTMWTPNGVPSDTNHQVNINVPNSIVTVRDGQVYFVNLMIVTSNSTVIVTDPLTILKVETSLDLYNSTITVGTGSHLETVVSQNTSISSNLYQDSFIMVQAGGSATFGTITVFQGSGINIGTDGYLIFQGYGSIITGIMNVENGSTVLFSTSSLTTAHNITGSGTSFQVHGEFRLNKKLNNDSMICSDCDVTVYSGGRLLFIAAILSLDQNSTLVNQIGGYTVVGGKVYIPPGSSIQNNGYLDYCGDVYPSRNSSFVPPPSVMVVNHGTWVCNMPMVNFMDAPFENNGYLNMVLGANVTFRSFRQATGEFLVGSGVVVSKAPIYIDDGLLHGNGTFVGNVTNSGVIGNSTGVDDHRFTSIKFNGDLIHKGKISLQVHNETRFSTLNITSQLVIDGGSIEVRINKYLLGNMTTNTTQTLDLMSFNNQTTAGSSTPTKPTIRIVTYDPDSGQETDAHPCNYKSQQSEKSLSVLITNEDNSDCGSNNTNNDNVDGTGMTKAQFRGMVAGIVLGCALVAALVALFLVKRTKLRLHFKKTYSSSINLSESGRQL